MRGSLLGRFSCRAHAAAAAAPSRLLLLAHQSAPRPSARRTNLLALMATSAPSAPSRRPPRPAAEVAADMIKFIDASWTQFHAVGEL
jgi:hypothetical protein